VNALRIRKRLDSPIPELPELNPMIGRVVEIIVLDESATTLGMGGTASSLQSFDDDSGPIPSFDDLLGGWPSDQVDDDFEQSVAELRHKRWTREID
jgi:hypothetical protein